MRTRRSHNEEMQRLWERYEESEKTTLTDKYEVAAWAIQNKLWWPHPKSLLAQCADELGKALRAEYRIDERGRKYRSKHAVRIDSGGVQMTLWGDIDRAPLSHMVKSLAQRRQTLVRMGFQLKTDADVTSDKHPDDPPIQTMLDLTNDVRELEAMRQSAEEASQEELDLA